MLDSMTGRGGGNRDRLTDFARAHGVVLLRSLEEALAIFAAEPAN